MELGREQDDGMDVVAHDVAAQSAGFIECAGDRFVLADNNQVGEWDTFQFHDLNGDAGRVIHQPQLLGRRTLRLGNDHPGSQSLPVQVAGIEGTRVVVPVQQEDQVSFR